jgi:hypothetical protein
VRLFGEPLEALGLGVLVVEPGGVFHQTFGAAPSRQRVDVELDGLVEIVGADDSDERERRDSGERTRRALEAAFAELRACEPALEFAEVSYESIWNVMLDARARDRDPERATVRERLVFAALSVRDLVLAALKTLGERPLDPARLGELLDQEHSWLRDGLGLSTARIEERRAATLSSGALGVKLAGDGLLAFAPGREPEVIEAVTRLGARALRLSASGRA